MTQAQKENSTKANFKPLGDRVLLRRLEAQDTLKGGILLPDSAKQKQEQAEVIAIGPGKKDKQGNTLEMPVKVGDIVLMEKYSGQEITVDDHEYMIVKADDLIAIVMN